MYYSIDATSSGTGDITIELAQGGKIGIYSSSRQYPVSNKGEWPVRFTGSLTSLEDVDKSQPFTVTLRFSVGADTFSDTIGVGECSASSTLISTHTVTPNSTTNGSVSCKPSPVAKGDTTICTATPELGYTLGDMTVASGSADPITCNGLICTLPNVQDDVTVSATFTPEYTVSDATPTGAGGTMDCTSPVQHGKDTTCTAKPELGYVFDKAMDISPKGAAQAACDESGCTLTNVVGDVTVKGVFKKEDYNIDDITDRVKGRVTCDRNPVPYGESTRCDATPAAGYVFDGTMSVTGATLGACDATGCELTNATGAVTVTGQFSKEMFAITDASDPALGSVTCTPNPVPYGESVTCTVSPASGYELSGVLSSGGVSWTCDPEALTCTSSAITSALSVRATFSKVPPQPQPYYYSDDSSPTLGELGLLLSGLALAGAAAPALRRREKQGKKADTRQ